MTAATATTTCIFVNARGFAEQFQESRFINKRMPNSDSIYSRPLSLEAIHHASKILRSSSQLSMLLLIVVVVRQHMQLITIIYRGGLAASMLLNDFARRATATYKTQEALSSVICIVCIGIHRSEGFAIDCSRYTFYGATCRFAKQQSPRTRAIKYIGVRVMNVDKFHTRGMHIAAAVAAGAAATDTHGVWIIKARIRVYNNASSSRSREAHFLARELHPCQRRSKECPAQSSAKPRDKSSHTSKTLAYAETCTFIFESRSIESCSDAQMRVSHGSIITVVKPIYAFRARDSSSYTALHTECAAWVTRMMDRLADCRVCTIDNRRTVCVHAQAEPA
uniref:Uncharacterized protein n=1 Tax=Trichogramma kaykai TaxID=54128 RepID=A0ABD2W7U3_9HYME